MKTLQAFSGGVDSTWLAYRVLTETDDELGLFWMDLSTVTYPDRKDGQPVRYYHDLLPSEKVIAPRIIEWLSKSVRPVTFEVVEGVEPDPIAALVPGLTSRAWRVPVMLKAAAEIVKRDGYERFIYAKTPENMRSPGQKDFAAFWQAYWQELAPGTTFETPLIKDWQGRPHAIAGLPEELFKLVLTCNSPVIVDGEPRNCTTCDKCHLTMESRRLMARGANPDDVLDRMLKLRKAGQYIDAPGEGDARFGAGRMSKFPPQVFEEKGQEEARVMFERVAEKLRDEVTDNPVSRAPRAPNKAGRFRRNGQAGNAR